MSSLTDPAIFDFAQLERVIPLGQSQTLGDGVLTAMSFEVYASGFIAVLMIEQRGSQPRGGIWVVNARDDRGQRYIGKMRAGHGGGSPDEIMQHRLVIQFRPRLDPQATALTFDVRQVQQPVQFVDGIGHFYPIDAPVHGPWLVTVPLRAGRESRSMTKPATVEPGAIFTSEQLIEVVPVGQCQVASDFALTVYSVERYRTGFLVVVRTDYPGERAPQPEPASWIGVDDRSSSYRGYDLAGSGGGIPMRHITWRVDYFFAPAIDPDASRLSLTIDAFDDVRLRPDPDQPGKMMREVRGTLSGPWHFSVDL